MFDVFDDSCTSEAVRRPSSPFREVVGSGIFAMIGLDMYSEDWTEPAKEPLCSSPISLATSCCMRAFLAWISLFSTDINKVAQAANASSRSRAVSELCNGFLHGFKFFSQRCRLLLLGSKESLVGRKFDSGTFPRLV